MAARGLGMKFTILAKIITMMVVVEEEEDYNDDVGGIIMRRGKPFHGARRVLQKNLWGLIIPPGRKF